VTSARDTTYTGLHPNTKVLRLCKFPFATEGLALPVHREHGPCMSSRAGARGHIVAIDRANRLANETASVAAVMQT